MRHNPNWATRLSATFRQHPEHLRALADTLQNQAIMLLSDADKIEEARAQRLDLVDRKRTIRYWAGESECRTDERCISGLASALSIPYGDAKMILCAEWAKGGHVAKARRNREIMRRARLGHCNRDIGAAVGLHPCSISRIIQQTLRGERR